MRKMKMITALMLALAMVFCFAACDSDSKKDEKKAGSKPEAAMDALIDYKNGDVDKLADLAPKAYWDYMEEEEDLDLDEYIEEMQEYYEDYADEYGKDTVSLVDLNEEELDEDELEAIKDALSDAYDIDPDSVTDGCILEYEVEVEYSDDEKESEDGKFHCLKIDGKWYIVIAHEYDGEWYVDFMA